jgi:hypothetical protein
MLYQINSLRRDMNCLQQALELLRLCHLLRNLVVRPWLRLSSSVGDRTNQLLTAPQHLIHVATVAHLLASTNINGCEPGSFMRASGCGDLIDHDSSLN